MDQPIITLRDVWDRLDQVSKGVSQIQSDTNVLKEQMRSVSEHNDDHERRIRETENVVAVVKDIPSRVSALEKKVWALPAASTVIALVSLLVLVYKAMTGH